MTIPRILISTGEPAGIGPDISLIAAQTAINADIITIGDPALFSQRAQELKLPIEIVTCRLTDKNKVTPRNTLKVLPVKLASPVVCGELNKQNARYVLDVLDIAIKSCHDKQADALVTGPIQKSILNHEISNFSGHTEYLAEQTGTLLPVMMLATTGLRVALVTTHLPLSKVPAMITQERLQQVIQILHHDLQHQFGISHPCILVTGLNPHAGENGYLGHEEQDVIEPVIQRFQQKGLNVKGPYPADTLFTEKNLEKTDAVLAMYHDQGLPVLKYKGFGNAINVTLGLPIVRTSVDHGTALDLAGTGKANAQSMLLAIQSALEISRKRKL